MVKAEYAQLCYKYQDVLQEPGMPPRCYLDYAIDFVRWPSLGSGVTGFTRVLEVTLLQQGCGYGSAKSSCYDSSCSCGCAAAATWYIWPASVKPWCAQLLIGIQPTKQIDLSISRLWQSCYLSRALTPLLPSTQIQWAIPVAPNHKQDIKPCQEEWFLYDSRYKLWAMF